MLVARLQVFLLMIFIAVPASGFADTSSFDMPLKHSMSKSHDVSGYEPDLLQATAILAESEPNDDPAQADALMIGDSIEASLTAADVDYFVVEGSAGDYLTLSTASREGSYLDTVLEVYASDGSTLLAQDDDSGLGLFSAIQHFLTETTGSYYVVVHHFSSTGSGDYLLAVESGTPPPPVPANNAVFAAIDVACNMPVLGTTLGATDSDWGVVDCVSHAPEGGDVFYRIELPYSYQLSLFLTPYGDYDPSMYIFIDPDDPAGSCLAGIDLGYQGEEEVLLYINETEGDPTILYLAVDSWSFASKGDFLLSVSCEFVVANEETSWGSVKARF